MEHATIIGIDLAKRSFQLHGARADGSIAFRKKLSREKVLGFIASQPRGVVAMEACASAHHWGREIGKLGHACETGPADLREAVRETAEERRGGRGDRLMSGGWRGRLKMRSRGCRHRSASWGRCCSVRSPSSTRRSRDWSRHCVSGRARTNRRYG